ncbi:sensor histidine kinase [Bifidobacterium bombi]|uniref:histidine kinase n=1 Tax=Bifidobacterium bombi DSM 19703 TaxID=1341695 RepID=A0A080N468_9BIFI|nr:PAS domain-containing sensor histidine kinase [Bifidobacterium bombi]KFF31085.1 signal transduction histidine kinase [Bifidobacterium bombi DSM 19703]
MADFDEILSTQSDFDAGDREWLHLLVADWQVVADLCFSDLLLILRRDDGKFIVAEQCRPSTMMTLRSEDVVGQEVPLEKASEVERAFRANGVTTSQVLEKMGNNTVCNVFAPVRCGSKTLGLVVRETNMSTRESNGRYENESINAGKKLYDMIARGQFPYHDALMSQRHNARVSDGFVVLSTEGVIDYASPNAISCFRRLGALTDMERHFLSEVGTKLIHRGDPVPDELPDVLSGKMAADCELDANNSMVSMRSLPLYDDEQRIGAIVLCRDVTELRRREQELQTKDATISEIHHRVKNNLQTVSALLRLQARKTKLPEVKVELKEAERRVQTIARVHEGLSKTVDEIVDFDDVISGLLKMSVDVATLNDQHINIHYIGKFGMMPAQDATPLSLVLTELITNAVEHGFESRKDGNITISVGRSGKHLNVVVEDDGSGIDTEEQGGQARSSGSGLGTQIINTFVTNDFGGTVRWEPSREGGTRVILDMKLRAAQD